MIQASASWAATEASSSRVVDRYVAGGFRGAPTLNVLEQRMATRLIRLAPPCTTIVADGQVLFRPLEDHFPNLRAVNHADDTEPSVMAAATTAASASTSEALTLRGKVVRPFASQEAAESVRYDHGPGYLVCGVCGWDGWKTKIAGHYSSQHRPLSDPDALAADEARRRPARRILA